MKAKEISKLLNKLRDALRQPDVTVRCQCDNLETVYIFADQGGGVRVTDDHRTFQYLDTCGNSCYVPVESLDMTVVQRLCEELRVELKPPPPDGYPSIECIVSNGHPVADSVERVAQAVDRVFELAMRKDLK